MASHNKSINKQFSVEQIINRWSFDFYVSKALEAFRNEDYDGFTQFKNLIERLVVRPIDGCSDLTIRLRFMQFLARINVGDRLDVTFQKPLTPLESALSVLESICTEIDISQETVKHVHTSIREMIIVVCIKNQQFEKAQEMLMKHFPEGMNSSGKKKLYMDLMKRRCSTHSFLNIISYNEFKQDMLDFIEKIYHIPEPFLVKMVNLSRRRRIADVGAACKAQVVRPTNVKSGTPDRVINKDPVPSDCSSSKSQLSTPIRNCQRAHSPALLVTVQLTQGNVKAIYPKLAERFSISVPFIQLEDELESEAQQETEIDSNMELCLQLTETPVEELVEEQERRLCPSDETLQSQNCTCLQTNATSQTDVTLEYCTSQHMEQEQESLDNTPLLDIRPHASSAENDEELAGVVSAVSVAQLVIEEDSLMSEESCDPQQTPSSFWKRSCEEDPLSSLPISSTPVRKYRRPRSSSKGLCSEADAVSHQKLDESQNCSSASRECNSRHSILHSPSVQPTERLPTQSEGYGQDNAESIVEKSPLLNKETPTAIKRRRVISVNKVQEKWTEEESVFRVSGNSSKGQSSSPRHSKRLWTEEETNWLKQGVARFGVGRWERIKSAFPFQDRTAVNIKDRWRTMKKANMV